jgi:hypothetical protein
MELRGPQTKVEHWGVDRLVRRGGRCASDSEHADHCPAHTPDLSHDPPCQITPNPTVLPSAPHRSLQHSTSVIIAVLQILVFHLVPCTVMSAPSTGVSMATIHPTTPVLPINSDINSPNTVFDYPDADIILRSRDEQEFRVFKLYIIHSSPVLGKRIQNISRPAISSDAKASLPVVQLPDNGDVLSTLLTFIFPVPPVLPSTLEKIMDLLSVAQTYEMVSVLVHIRGSIALRESPFICPENAFYAYSLARKHGLREEAAQAAKISLAFNLIIENLEARSDIPQGVYLHELWQYHQNVRSNLLSSVDNFRGSAAGAITGLTCTVLTIWGTPNWLDSYIVSIARTPSSFNTIDFQTTLACHVRGVAQFSGNSCLSCTNIPRQTMHKFWTALTNFVNENIAKVSGINMDLEPPNKYAVHTGRIAALYPRVRV